MSVFPLADGGEVSREGAAGRNGMDGRISPEGHDPPLLVPIVKRAVGNLPAEAPGVLPGTPEETTQGRGAGGRGKKGKEGKNGRGKGKGGGGDEEVFDVMLFVRQRNIWWLGGKGSGYFMPGPDGRWMQLNRQELVLWLQAEGLPVGSPNEPIREVERVLLCVQGHRQLSGVMNLAGHMPGVEIIRGARVLIREGPALLTPVRGDFPLITRLMEGLFCLPLETGGMPAAWRLLLRGDRNHDLERQVWQVLCREVPAVESEPDGKKRWVFDQRAVVFAWLKLALEVYYRRAAGELEAKRNGQALAIAGPPQGGKSLFFSYVVAPLLGNRMSSAAKYLTGKTSFNANLFQSELLVLSDTPLSNKMEDRNTLGDGIKNVVAEQWHAWEGKGKDAVDQLDPIWRLIIGLNDDQNNIRTLPPFSVEGVGDKIHLLHASSGEMPMPTTTLDEYLAFGRALARELPAFAHYLMHEYVIPAPLLGSRFGMITIQSPDLMREMFEESPSGELLELLDMARWTAGGEEYAYWQWVDRMVDGGNSAHGKVECLRVQGDQVPICWQGSALDLKHLLTEDACNVHREAQQLFKFNKPERLLGRLAKEESTRVKQHRTNLQRQWRISVPGVVVA